MKSVVALLCGVVFVGNTFAGPLVLSDVASDAKWVFHFDWESYKSTDMHMYVKTMPAREKKAAKMAEAAEMLGFNPLEDIDSVTAYGDTFEREEGVMIVKGQFAPDKAIALMQKAQSYSTKAYGKYTIHSWSMQHHHRQKKGSCVFYDARTAVLSKDSASLISALEVLNAQEPSLMTSSDGIVVPELSKDVFVMAYASKMEMGQHPKAAVLKNVNAITIAAAESDGVMAVEVDLDASSADEAVLIQNAAAGMLSLGMLRAKDDPAMTELMQAMAVRAEDNTVKLSFHKNSDELLAVMMEQIANRSRHWGGCGSKKKSDTAE
jgi:hypothetical protein